MSTEVVIYTVLAVVVALILGYVSFVKQKKVKEERRPPRPRVGAAVDRGDGAAPNRAAANRNARARMRMAAQRPEEESDEDEDIAAALGEDIALPEGKIGKKKLAKLQAKAEKKAAREAEEREREEKRERAERTAEEKRIEEEKEAEEQAKREEKERKEREEREQRELEEYMKLKAEFEVQEEGFDETAEEEQQNLLLDFINHIKNEKVVILEDLASKFKLKTQDVINRVTELQKEGTITGVIDDRGKFIYISKEELEGFAKFIKQRGRVSIAELAESSNSLITLTPEIAAAT